MNPSSCIVPPTAHPFTACQHTLHKVRIPNTCSEHNAQADERTSYTMLNNHELFDGFMEEALSLNPGTRPREMKGHKQTDLWLNLTTATTLKRKPFAVCFAVKNASLPSCSSPGTLLSSHTKTYPLQGTHLLQYKLCATVLDTDMYMHVGLVAGQHNLAAYLAATKHSYIQHKYTRY